MQWTARLSLKPAADYIARLYVFFTDDLTQAPGDNSAGDTCSPTQAPDEETDAAPKETVKGSREIYKNHIELFKSQASMPQAAIAARASLRLAAAAVTHIDSGSGQKVHHGNRTRGGHGEGC